MNPISVTARGTSWRPATDGAVIAQVERRSLDQAQKRMDAEVAENYAKSYAAGRF